MASKDTESQGSRDPLREILDEKSLADEITKAIAGNDCPGDKELLAYTRKELQDAERVEVKSHLLFCNRCRERERQLSRDDTLRNGKEETKVEKKNLPGFNLRLGQEERRRPFALKVGLAATAALGVGLIGYLALLWTGSEVSFGGAIVHAQSGPAHLQKGKPFFYEIRTHEPVYLIQITIEGDGHINSRIPPGNADGQFRDQDRIQITPMATGEFDLYLIPRAVQDGFPNRLLDNILKFVKTEKSLSRVNQRRGVEMALGLYRVKFVHEITSVEP